MVPEWISDLAPFAAAIAGMGVGYGMLKQKLDNIGNVALENKHKLADQVGEARCSRIREECREAMKESINEIKEELRDHKDVLFKEIKDLSRFMGRMNGEKH